MSAATSSPGTRIPCAFNLTSVGPVRLCTSLPVAGGGVEEDVAHALVAVHEPPFRLVGDALDVSGARVVVEVDLRGDHQLRRSDHRGEQEGYVDDVLEGGELAPQLLLDSWVDGLADEQGDVGPRSEERRVGKEWRARGSPY